MSLATVNGKEIGYVKILLGKASETDTGMHEHCLGQLLEIVELAQVHSRGRNAGVEYYYHVMWVEWEMGFA